MARIAIYLDKDETEEEAQEALLKALQHHAAGKEHREAFHDPAARDVFNKLINEHKKMWNKMLKDIQKVLDEEA